MRLEVAFIHMSYRTGLFRRCLHNVLEGIDLALEPGETVGITGVSGAGKTTLGFILAGMLRPDAGVVRYNGADVWEAPPKIRKSLIRALQMVFQHPETTFDPLWTMQQSLSEPYRLQGISPSIETLEDALNRVGIPPQLLQRRPYQLSGGELQRIAIARVMALSPGIVVLDEPTGMLDALTQARIMGLLKRIQTETGIGYILITHDPALAARFCDRVHRLEGGRLAS